MNVIFSAFCVISILIMLFSCPEKILEAMIEGSTKAISLSIGLASVYGVWLGLFSLLERGKIVDKLAIFLKKPVEKLFGKCELSTRKALVTNISANILGLGAIATPWGIEACSLLEKEGKEDKSQLLLILSSTSLQILPTSIIALAVKNGSKNPSALIFPALLCTLFSSILGVTLYFVFEKLKKKTLRNKIAKKNSSLKCKNYKIIKGKNLK